ncbi:hypothetical protein HYE60_11080 [Aggregatibacter actinomycetemcomitans]|uniref:hypothetical protein n=1 Tax=Aggregatibacter actinomycetemcomitans TaxID=714 RepID=UPI00197C21FE|nr:hypothetical protein [Aggregatibacter actinomycetemcomitans]MBN6075776.1 hypothetical protein [Aggregatibacter actinomycetemcomitans]
MKSLTVLILIFVSCFCIANVTDGATGVFSLALCFVSFIFGVYVYHDQLKDKVKNSELLEIGKKYYVIKYVKDKVG